MVVKTGAGCGTILLILAAVVLLPLVFMAMCTGAFFAGVSEVAKHMPEETLSASALYVALSTDDPAAKRDLAGKVLRITGKVRGVDQAASDAPVVVLDAGGTGGGVRCVMRVRFKSASDVPRAGSERAVVGTVQGFVDNAVTLTDCLIFAE